MIEIKNISKELFGESGLKRYELKNISFPIQPGKITSILGSSGSGKTTLLKLIASLGLPSGGQIINASGKKIIYIPTEPSSFPWLSVKENISFGLSKCSDGEINRLLGLVGLDGYSSFYPNNKSLGFRFRISLARSLAHNHALILLDNPFCKMDALTRNEIYNLIAAINSNESITFILATSNVHEAVLLSDHVYLLRSGLIEGVQKEKLQVNFEQLNSHEIHSTIRSHIETILGKLNPEELSKISF